MSSWPGPPLQPKVAKLAINAKPCTLVAGLQAPSLIHINPAIARRCRAAYGSQRPARRGGAGRLGVGMRCVRNKPGGSGRAPFQSSCARAARAYLHTRPANKDASAMQTERRCAPLLARRRKRCALVAGTRHSQFAFRSGGGNFIQADEEKSGQAHPGACPMRRAVPPASPLAALPSRAQACRRRQGYRSSLLLPRACGRRLQTLYNLRHRGGLAAGRRLGRWEQGRVCTGRRQAEGSDQSDADCKRMRR